MEIIIDGKVCNAERGEYILDIAKRNDIYIPTLCHSDALPGQGNCRLCIVEVIDNNRRKIVTSCMYPVKREIEVITNSKKVMDMRKAIIMLLSVRVPENRQIKALKDEYDVPDITRFSIDRSEECILCGLCVRACDEMGLSAISTVNRGVTKKVTTPYDEPSRVCIGCAACVSVCPTGAIKISEKDGIRTIWNRDFELLKCQECGEYFVTREQIEYIKNKTGMTEDLYLCDRCRKKASMRKLKEIYESVSMK